jgi:pimeloyl-ACP methyl ester carboxylesterase
MEYAWDVNEEEAILSHTHPYIIENSPVPQTPQTTTLPIPEGAYKAMDPADQAQVHNMINRMAFVNMPGFGLVDTYEGDQVFKPFGRIAANWSMHYDNAGVDPIVNARTIVKQARAENINQVALDGDSMGTIIATETAVNIEKIAPDITIPFIVMDSPAVGLQVLRPQSLSNGFTMLKGDLFPGAHDSRFARVAAEMYLRMGQIHDLASFDAVLSQVHDEVFNNRDLAGNSLLVEQFQMIRSADVEGDLRELGKLPADKRPVIVFMGAEHAIQDDVVNTPKSYALLKKWTAEAKLSLLGPYGIEHFYHGAQWRSMSEYHDVLSNQVIPDVMQSLATDGQADGGTG